ncbi:YesL family protein [Virgibacillus soli]|uniref:DUF624 domain-containing protein n=1 Tax=Paracerasibacillus soli TaxID=480284 RepID=A0ABU5CRQ7_9BACI|nr:DUF624 domain-containing protein [Virgibacillus soli]MDY0409053.1 DUF624 domain-containing protein [Virgibacillus soli]
MSGFVGGYYRFSLWTMRLAYLNFCWVLFTIFGLVLFGFMPATTAMFAVIRKWQQGQEDIPIFSTFWKTYRTEFFKTNGIGMILFAIGYLLIIEFNILRLQDSIVYQIVSFSVLVTIVIYIVVVIYFFPIFVHFKLKFIDYLKWPFIIGIKHPILTVFILCVTGIVYYTTWISIPALLFFFGGSVTALFTSWAVSQTFQMYEYNEG